MLTHSRLKSTFFCKKINARCFMLGTNRKRDQPKAFSQNPCCRISLHTMPRKVKKKSDESQFSACNSVKPKTAPTHAFICTAIGHFPSAETNHRTVVIFLVDKKVLRGAENLVDSNVAVFADIGNTFKGSKNFSDHIFYWLRLGGNDVHVNTKNFTVTV